MWPIRGPRNLCSRVAWRPRADPRFVIRVREVDAPHDLHDVATNCGWPGLSAIATAFLRPSTGPVF